MSVRSPRRYLPFGLLARAMATAGLTLALLVPADAQFWGNWGTPRPQPRQQQNYNNGNNNGGYNPFGGGFFGPAPTQPQGGGGERREQREVDYSKAPSPSRKPDSAATTPIVVMGDSMADWLAYGLEDAFSERSEIGVVRKNRSGSGLIRYEARRETEWAQVVREAIAADKPKFIVFMIGVNDRQSIRERAPTAAAVPLAQKGALAKPAAPPAAAAAPAAPAPTEAPPSEDPETTETVEQAPAADPARAGATSTYEFHTEKWEAAYVKRIDATLVALKSAGVPVYWVGLPAQRAARASSDSAYLNDLYRARAEKAGVTYVDVWDGFVDESGRFAAQGPDFEGQTRRLRTGDGVYFTKAGASKLAHYVEREISRSLGSQVVPVALPIEPAVPTPAAPGAKPNGPPARPLVGPAVPLTASASPAEDLIGGGNARAPRASTPEPAAARVLTKGEPVSAPVGRADDFSWPRGNVAATSAQPVALPPDPEVDTPATAGQPRGGAQANAPGGSEKQNGPRTTRTARPDNDGNELRPPGSVGGTQSPQRRTRTTSDAPPRSPSFFGGFGLFR